MSIRTNVTAVLVASAALITTAKTASAQEVVVGNPYPYGGTLVGSPIGLGYGLAIGGAAVPTVTYGHKYTNGYGDMDANGNPIDTGVSSLKMSCPSDGINGASTVLFLIAARQFAAPYFYEGYQSCIIVDTAAPGTRPQAVTPLDLDPDGGSSDVTSTPRVRRFSAGTAQICASKEDGSLDASSCILVYVNDSQRPSSVRSDNAPSGNVVAP